MNDELFFVRIQCEEVGRYNLWQVIEIMQICYQRTTLFLREFTTNN